MFISLMVVTAASCLSQVITKSSQGTVEDATCPGIGIQYEVSLPSGFEACHIDWTITNGSKQSQSGNTITVLWNDVPGTKGKVEATFSACGNSNDGETATPFEELILSVKGQNFDAYTNSITVDYCTTQSITLTVPHMYVQGTGGVAQPPLQEVVYTWTLPPGWTTCCGLSTSLNGITITPTSCAAPGQIAVKGNIMDRCGSAGLSNPAVISLVGAQPFVSLGIPPGYSGATFCNTTPLTFTANMSPSLSCVSSYNWSKPTSWTAVSQSGNTISLQPGGTSSDSGPISVSVTFTCGTSVTSASYTPIYTPPSIAGSDLICDSQSYSVINANGASSFWSSSNTDGLTVSSQSDGTFSAVPGFIGPVDIIDLLTCGANQTSAQKTVHVGAPSADMNTLIYPTNQYGVDPVTLVEDFVYQFNCDYVPGAQWFTWYVPAGFSIVNGRNTDIPGIRTSSTDGFYTLTCTANNDCGESWTHDLDIILDGTCPLVRSQTLGPETE